MKVAPLGVLKFQIRFRERLAQTRRENRVLFESPQRIEHIIGKEAQPFGDTFVISICDQGRTGMAMMLDPVESCFQEGRRQDIGIGRTVGEPHFEPAAIGDANHMCPVITRVTDRVW